MAVYNSLDTSYLYFPKFWKTLHNDKILSIFADSSHLAIPQVKLALPYLMNILTYQLMVISQQSPNRFTSLLTSFEDSLGQFTHTNNLSWWKSLDFATIKILKPVADSTKKHLFPDIAHYYQLLGYVITHTHIPLSKLEILLQWEALLAIASLLQIIKNSSLTEKQLLQWVALQPNLGIQVIDMPIITILNIKLSASLQQLISHQSMKQTPSFFEVILLIIHTQFLTQTANYSPGDIKNKTVKQTKLIEQSLSNKPTNTIITSIFDSLQLSKPSVTNLLQKYWIATSVLLTTVTFGIISLFSSTMTENKPATNAVNSVRQPIHDIAILKLDSSPITTVTHSPKMQLINTDKISKKMIKENSKASLEKTKINKANTKKDNPKSTKSIIKTDDKSKLKKLNDKDKNPKNRKPA